MPKYTNITRDINILYYNKKRKLKKISLTKILTSELPLSELINLKNIKNNNNIFNTLYNLKKIFNYEKITDQNIFINNNTCNKIELFKNNNLDSINTSLDNIIDNNKINKLFYTYMKSNEKSLPKTTTNLYNYLKSFKQYILINKHNQKIKT